MAKTLEEKIAIMQAYLNGKPIEVKISGLNKWELIYGREPNWNWGDTDYRVKEPTKPSINWDHISKSYKYLFYCAPRDKYLLSDLPPIMSLGHNWLLQTSLQPPIEASVFSSFKPGCKECRDIVVKRGEVYD